MRKEKKTAQTAPALARVQGYHEGGWGRGESYAYEGFAELLYFTSDRAIKLLPGFVRPDGKPLKGYGLEIETECSKITDQTVLAEVYEKIIFPAFPTHLFKMQRDGSLGGRSSAECITQVMTREAVRNMYPAFKVMFNTYFDAFGISASESGNCGMHTNISLACFGASTTAQDEAVRKLYYFINRWFNLACDLLLRPADRTQYCGRMRYEDAQTMDLHAQACSHGVAFNLGHYNAGRIELRLVGGQPSFGGFRNTMETIFWLVDAVKRVSWKTLQDGDFVKIFSGCNQYVFDRIASKAARHFNPAQLLELRQAVKPEELL